MSKSTATLAKFDLKFPFTYRDAEYSQIELRRPKVRDLKQFVKDAEKDAVAAIEKVLSNLSDLDEKIITELDLEDFAPIKAWFETFLKFISDESEK